MLSQILIGHIPSSAGFTYDWLPVNTAVREFPHTFLNAMDYPGPSR